MPCHTMLVGVQSVDTFYLRHPRVGSNLSRNGKTVALGDSTRVDMQVDVAMRCQKPHAQRPHQIYPASGLAPHFSNARHFQHLTRPPAISLGKLLETFSVHFYCRLNKFAKVQSFRKISLTHKKFKPPCMAALRKKAASTWLTAFLAERQGFFLRCASKALKR